MDEQRTGKNPPTGGTSNPQHESQSKQELGTQQGGQKSSQGSGNQNQRAIANDVGNPLPENAVGDRGQKGTNWQPRAGEQGLSNRPDDEADGSAGQAFAGDTGEVDTANLQGEGETPGEGHSSKGQWAERQREGVGNDPSKFRKI